MASAGQVFAARTLTNTLTATPTTVGYGGSVTLNGTIAYSANGPENNSNLTGLAVRLTIPTGATITGLTGSGVLGTGYTYNSATGDFVFTGTSNAIAEGTYTYSITFTISSTQPSFTATSYIKASNSTNPAANTEINDSASVTVTNNSPFLGVTLTSSANPVNAGSALTLTVGITNTGIGTTTATGVVRTVTGLPTGLTGVTFGGTGATGATYNSGAGTVTFTGGSTTLAQGGNTLNFTISFTAPVSPTSFTAVATVSATNQTNSSNPTASLTQTITPVADVTTTLTGPATLPQGGSGTFTVTYTNNGPSVAPTVTRTVTIPAGATNIVAPGGGVSGAGPYTITYPALTNQASGGTASFTFSFTAPTTGTTMNTVSNTGVTGIGEGANTGPNSATVATALSASADVSATITAPATAAAGSNISFLPVITNTSGTNAATNVVVTVQMGTGLTGVSASDFGVYDAGTGLVTFPARTLAAGASFQPVIRRTVPASGTISATVSATSDSDPNAANNNGTAANATATVTVTQVADVAIAVSGPAGATPGSVLVYSVLLTNLGSSTATGVTAQLVLTGSPTGITVSSGSVSGSTVTFTVPGGTLTAGQAVSYTVRFTVPNSIGSSVGGTVSAASTTTNGDPVATNNNGTAPASQVTTAILASTPSEVCAIPGSSGNLTYSGTQNVNTFYPGTANAAANQKVVSIGTAVFSGTTGQTPLAAGDLVLIMQMQGAAINTSNTNAYGSGNSTTPTNSGPGRGYLSSNLTAGQYEYGVVASVTGTTSFTLVSNLLNSYESAAATATSGVRTFQVVRVPQYQDLTLSANMTAPAWNGSTGGILALDVAGTLTLNGFKIDMAGKGFRGGAGRQLAGAAGLVLTDYRTPATTTSNAAKGEGIAGTPRYVNPGGTAVTATDLGAAVGYPDGTTVGGGDNARGAAGNAGGGGTDTNPTANDENTGGGGGSNGGIGGQGGNGWRSNLPYGGFGGAPFTQAAPSRLIMGGGGGAGTTNNGTVDTGNAGNNNVGGIAGNNVGTGGFASSGASGGGMVIVRASNVSGTGTIDVSGADMKFVALNDGSGGGGAGGSVLLVSNNTAANALTGVTILANGGKGGSNTGNGEPHGPGGGGSGGVAFTSSPVSSSSSFVAGTNGTTAGGITYEAGAGTSSDAFVRNTTGFDETPFLQSGANCVADLTTTISGPSIIGAGLSSGPFTVTFTNNGLGTGSFNTRSITLPAGASLSAAQVTALNSTYGLTGNGLNTGSYTTTGSGATAVTTINFGTSTQVVSGNTASYTFSFTAPAATGTYSGTTGATSGLNSALTPVTTAGANFTNEGANVAANTAAFTLTVITAPIAQNVSNTAILSTSGATTLSPGLSGTAFGTGNTITSYTIASLPAGGTLTYNGTVLTSGNIATTSITNLALLTYTPSGTFSGNDTFTYTVTDANGVTSGTNRTGTGPASAGPATYTVPITPVADVATSVTPSVNPVNAGGTLSFAVTYTNAGPNTAAGYTQTLQLSAGLGAGNVTFTGLPTGVTASYDNVTGTVTFTGTPTTLASGANQNLTVNIASVPASLTQVTASTTVGTTTNQGANTGANSATSTVNVTPVADVATSISTSANPVSAGSPLTLTLTFINNGPSTAAGYTRTVTLPAGLGAGVTVTGGTYNNATGAVTFTTPPTTLASGASANVTVTIPNVPASFATIAVATSTGTTTSQNGATSNDNASLNVTVTPIADVATSITPSVNPANAGSALSFAVTYTNAGPSTAAGYTQTLQLTAGLGAGNVTFTGLPTGVTAAYNNTTGAVTFSGTPTTLASGANQNLTVNIASVPASLTQVVASTTVGTSTSQGTDSGANSASSTVNVTPVADVATTISGSPSPVNAGGSLTIAVTFANNGPSTAATVTRQVQLPAGLGAGNVTATNGGTYDNATGLVTYPSTGTLANGANLNSTITIASVPASFTTITATSTVGTATSQNGATSNDTATMTPVTVTPVADVATTLTGPASLTGNVATSNTAFTVTFSNNGPSTAANVTRIVTLPPGATMTPAQVTASGGTYTAPTSTSTSGTLNFGNLATLASGGSSSFSFGFVPYNGNTSPAVTTSTITTSTSQNGAITNDVATVSSSVRFTLVAVDDFATTAVNTPVTFAVAANDSNDNGAAINPATIDLDPNTAGIQTSITTAQGTFTTVGAPAGSVTFTPASATFTGTATTPYTIQNTASPAATSNQANLIVTVRPNLPVDLSTTVAAATNPVNAGAPETLTVTATNNGTTTATAVVQTVSIPTGLTVATLTIGGQTGTLSGSTISFANGASYNTTTGLVTFASQSLTAGQTQTYPLVAFTAPVASFTATAQVGNGTTDPTPANNVASVNVTVNAQFDLTTTLNGPASVVSGDLATFVVSSRNNGPSAVTNAVQTLQLPTSLTGVYITNGGTYNSSTGVVTFPAVALASGQAVTNSVAFAPTASFSPQAIISTATAGETTVANNTANLNGAPSLTPVTVTGPTAGSANTYVTVSGPATVNPGASTTYTVTQGNYGPNTAANVVTTVSLPTGLTALTVAGQAGTPSGNTISFASGASYNTLTGVLTLPTLASQASAATPQSYSIVFNAPTAGTFNVTANVAASTTDPVPTNNVASVMTNINPTADVAISLSGPASATAGQPLSYNLTLTNNSATVASGVVQQVSLPAGLTATDLRVGGATGTLSGSIITFPNGATYDNRNGLLTLATIATLPGGSTQTTAIVFSAPGNTTSLVLPANVTSTSNDAVLSNNATAAVTTLTGSADVVVAVAGPATVTVGNPVTYVVTTTNNGPSTAGSETTTVQLPTGLSGVVVRDNTGAIVAGAYNATTGIVTFATVSNLAAGSANAQTGTITFNAPDTNRLDVAAVASVPAANGDPNLDNNRATVVTTVTTPNALVADVAVTLVPNVSTQAPGLPVVYTLTTQNNTAANPASSVVRQVTLPAGLSSSTLALNGTTGSSTSGNVITFTGGPNDGATYNTLTGVLTLPTIASLTNGSPVATTITVTAPGSGPLVASATVAGANTDPTLSNNTAQATSVTITASNDVATYITAPASAAAGSTVGYLVTTANNGPSNVSSLVQTVNLPAGATSITAPAGATVSGTTVTYTVTGLTSGSSVSNIITFVMPNVASAVGTASVPTTNDAVTSNNTSTATITRPNIAPVAYDVVNSLQSPEGNTATGPLPISPLNGTDTDGTIATYQLLSIPATTQGVLYYDNGGTYTAITAANFASLNLTPAQAASLRFDPASTFAGSVPFTYQTTDNLNAVSAPATYTIQTGIDNPSLYAATPSKGGAVHYQNNDVLAFVIDPNGAQYNASGLIYNATTGVESTSGVSNGLATTGTNAVLTPISGPGSTPAPSTNPTNTLPSGTALNPATGQIYVIDRSLLPAITVPTSYTVNITTTDVYGGVTTQPVTFTIGAYPLPMELTVFSAQAVNNTDAKLAWTTASERNNDHFDVERSLNGQDFVKVGAVDGKGTSSAPTSYTLTDAGIGRQVNGAVYYRLKQVDRDGAFSYSPVRTVTFTKALTPAFSIYPNPATTEAQLDLSKLPAGSYQVVLFDATGRQVLGLQVTGGLTQAMPLRTLATGTYLVRVLGKDANGSALQLNQRLVKE